MRRGSGIWYHDGSLVGFFSSFHVLPESGTIIVTNSISKIGVEDWIGQSVVKESLKCVGKCSFVSLAREVAAMHNDMLEQFIIDI